MKAAVFFLLVASCTLISVKAQQGETQVAEFEKDIVDVAKEFINNPALADVIFQDPELSKLASEILDDSRGERLLLLGKKAKLALKFLFVLNRFVTIVTTTTTAATVAGRRRR